MLSPSALCFFRFFSFFSILSHHLYVANNLKNVVKRLKSRRKQDKARKAQKKEAARKQKQQQRDKFKDEKERGLVSEFRPVDRKSAARKIVMGAAEFCKEDSSAVDPATRADQEGAGAIGTTEAFLRPGVFKELIRKHFRISLSPAELGATGEFRIGVTCTRVRTCVRGTVFVFMFYVVGMGHPWSTLSIGLKKVLLQIPNAVATYPGSEGPKDHICVKNFMEDFYKQGTFSCIVTFVFPGVYPLCTLTLASPPPLLPQIVRIHTHAFISPYIF
jgi:hypothetical protein